MDRRIGLELRKVQQLIKHSIAKKRAEENINLTHGQVRVLLYISKQDKPVYQRDIENMLHVRRSTATEMLNVLERDGYIVRQRSPHDGRLKEISVSPLSLQLTDKMDRHMDDLEERLIKNISEEDLKIFYKVLDQVGENTGENA
ncbi:MAG: winged helix-turn-helix transcriptional regulator [Clostridiaceae bacterium]|nr:winged helix-turn-helix transcriptional regulator [Clostridiaceae bacterium]